MELDDKLKMKNESNEGIISKLQEAMNEVIAAST